MDGFYVTIGGQTVRQSGQAPLPPDGAPHPDARDATGRLLAITQMSPTGWPDASDDERLELRRLLTALIAALIAATLISAGLAILLRKPR